MQILILVLMQFKAVSKKDTAMFLLVLYKSLSRITYPEVYLEPSRTSKMVLFSENS